ncbi:MAG: hypothetical protein ACOYWZ_21265 [Bacillota bacterium]
MKKYKLAVLTALLVSLMSTTCVFAKSNEPKQSVSNIVISQVNFEKSDPIKDLQTLRKEVQEDYKQGNISKDELDLALTKIDRKLNAVKEFNKLSLEQKKDRLINEFTKAVNRKVQEGKISENDMEKIISVFTEKVNAWDGKGYPTFYHNGVKVLKKDMHDHSKHHMHMHMHMYKKFVEALDKAVKEGTINEHQKQQILKHLKHSMMEMK